MIVYVAGAVFALVIGAYVYYWWNERNGQGKE